MFTIFSWLNVIFSCFKQSPLNLTLALVPAKANEGSTNLLDVVGALILSSHDPLDFHDKIILGLSLAVLKYLCIGWNTNQFCAHDLQNNFYHDNNSNQRFLIFSIHFQQLNALFYLQ